MQSAVHKMTGGKFRAYQIWTTFNNPYEEKWVCCPEEDFEVFPVREHFRHCDGGKTHVISHFRHRPDESCKYRELGLHEKLETLVATLVENKEVTLEVLGTKIPWQSLSFAKVPELKHRWEQEIGERRPDVNFELTNFHPILGKGILFEIQLSQQGFEKQRERTFDLLREGWSLTWLTKEDFSEDGLGLKSNVIKIEHPYFHGMILLLSELLKEAKNNLTETEKKISGILSGAEFERLGISAELHELKDTKQFLENQAVQELREQAIERLANLEKWIAKTCRTCKYSLFTKTKTYSGQYVETGTISCFRLYDRFAPKGKRGEITVHEPFDTCEWWKQKGQCCYFKNGPTGVVAALCKAKPLGVDHLCP